MFALNDTRITQGNRLDIRQLEAFRSQMLWRSSARAAAAMHLSHTAIARLIAALEDDVGFALFVRERGNAHPTAEALALFEEVERSFVGFEKVERAASHIRSQRCGSLRVASTPTLALSFLPRAIAAFVAQHVDVRVTSVSRASRDVIAMVLEQACDVAFVAHPMGRAAPRDELFLSTAALCALPVTHRLAHQEIVELTDLEGESFIATPRSLDARSFIDTLLASHGIRGRHQVEVETTAGQCSVVATGLGVALVDPVTAREYRGSDLVFRPFRPQVRVDFSVLTPASALSSALAESFVEHARMFALREIDPTHMIEG